MTVATIRSGGFPSPLEAGTHDANISDLPPPIPFEPSGSSSANDTSSAEGSPKLVTILFGPPPSTSNSGDSGSATPPEGIIDLGGEAPAWLGATAKLIRPLCVGALMAIPTVGAASVGLVAIFSPATALGMSEASTRFLAGIPGDIVALIGFLAGGYTIARSAEKIIGPRR